MRLLQQRAVSFLLPAKASFVDSQLSLRPLDDSALRSYASATLRRDSIYSTAVDRAWIGKVDT